MNVREKVENRLKALERSLKEGRHIISPEGKAETQKLVSSISKFASILSDEDRDFLTAAKEAIACQMPWK